MVLAESQSRKLFHFYISTSILRQPLACIDMEGERRSGRLPEHGMRARGTLDNGHYPGRHGHVVGRVEHTKSWPGGIAMRYEVTTTLTPQEALERASIHFGPQGEGL